METLTDPCKFMGYVIVARKLVKVEAELAWEYEAGKGWTVSGVSSIRTPESGSLTSQECEEVLDAVYEQAPSPLNRPSFEADHDRP